MNQPPTQRPSDDEIMRQLREAVRKRRPWSRRGILIALALLAIPLALLGWWLLPSTEPPRLHVFAFDALAVAGEPLTLHAKLEPVEAAASEVNLAGFRVSFEEGQGLANPAQPVKRVIGVSSKKGDTAVAWTEPVRAPVSEFVVRYNDTHRKQMSMDRARVFTWPAQTALLVVDVQSTLTLASDAVWRNANILDIPAVAEAGKALQAAEAKGYRIVYLAADADSAALERKVRSWVENRITVNYPHGAVLGRSALAKEATAEAAREEILRDLQKRFAGTVVVVVGKAETARTALRTAAKTLLVGEVNVPPGVDRLAAWGDLAAQLPAARDKNE